MNNKKAPVVNLSATLNRIVLLFIAIVTGLLLSFSSANAAANIGKNPSPQATVKKKNHTYSCEVLMKKQRNSSNIVVRPNHKRPKWR